VVTLPARQQIAEVLIANIGCPRSGPVRGEALAGRRSIGLRCRRVGGTPALIGPRILWISGADCRTSEGLLVTGQSRPSRGGADGRGWTTFVPFPRNQVLKSLVPRTKEPSAVGSLAARVSAG
jgi:hypothetical protein